MYWGTDIEINTRAMQILPSILGYYQGPFSISLPQLSQLKAKSWSQPSNLLQTGFLSCVQVSDLSEILTWDSN